MAGTAGPRSSLDANQVQRSQEAISDGAMALQYRGMAGEVEVAEVFFARHAIRIIE